MPPRPTCLVNMQILDSGMPGFLGTTVSGWQREEEASRGGGGGDLWMLLAFLSWHPAWGPAVLTPDPLPRDFLF